MSRPAPRSIEEYLKQLRAALEGADPALIQDALYDSEEYLRAEIAAYPEKSEADVLELIATTYGAPEEVAAAYQATEAKVKEALRPPPPRAAASPSAWRRFFGVYSDARAYTSLFYMLLTLATGIVYFVFVIAGLSMSAGLAVLIIGVPFFLAFVGIARVISLGEGRLLEAVTGERMPRRPVHPGAAAGWWARIIEMLRDPRTWSTLAYLVLMLPLGIVYFVIATTGIALGGGLIVAPLVAAAQFFGWPFVEQATFHPEGLATGPGVLLCAALGVVIFTALMHLARGVGRMQVAIARALLVKPGM
ncbi:MAG TPA: sensor domain-containing protein [Steroidobacteraceae bacterium]|nr:sensor domain-containing protein [Steroidobacteraceae bacterium]